MDVSLDLDSVDGMGRVVEVELGEQLSIVVDLDVSMRSDELEGEDVTVLEGERGSELLLGLPRSVLRMIANYAVIIEPRVEMKEIVSGALEIDLESVLSVLLRDAHHSQSLAFSKTVNWDVYRI